MTTALVAHDAAAFDQVYGDTGREVLESLVTLIIPDGDHDLSTTPGLDDVEILLTGWGGPSIDAAFLELMPRLRVVLCAGGLPRVTTPDFWRTEIPLASAAAANAIPVADYTVAQIVLALKDAHRLVREVRSARTFTPAISTPGVYGATVGLLSLGRIGCLVAERLRGMDVHVLAHDPHVTPEAAARTGCEAVDIEALFRRSEVVSIHTPWLPETEGIVTGALLRTMPVGATLINTARGAIIDHTALVQVLGERPDLWAILDVTWPEPPPATSPLYDLPNVFLTPHLAGSTGRERQRLGLLLIEELQRFLRGEPLQHRVGPAGVATHA